MATTQHGNDSQKAGNTGKTFANDHEKAAEAGRKGGQHSHSGSAGAKQGEGSTGKQAGEAGRNGGEHSAAGHTSHKDSASTSPQHGTDKSGGTETQHSHAGHAQGGSGNFANDPQRASEAGQKGGHSHGHK